MPPASPTPSVEELRNALLTRDASAVSALAAALVGAGQADVALDVVARHVAAGDAERGTLEVLVETLDASGAIHRIAGSMLLDRAAVDDVAQESLISVLQSIGSYRGESAFTTWVYPIVRRRVADHLRRSRETAGMDDEELPSERMSSMIATRETVRQSLARLPGIYREPVTMRDLDGMTYAEIAAKLGRSVGTIKSQVSRGRAMLAGSISDATNPSGGAR